MSDTNGQGAGEYVPRALSDILNRDSDATHEREPAGQAASEQAAETGADTGEKADPDGRAGERDERGRFAGRAAENAAGKPVPPAGEDEQERVPRAALRDERSKRQEAERRAAELEARLAQQQQPRTPSEQAEAAREAERQWNADLNASEKQVRRKYPDVDDKISVFLEAAKLDPSLGAKLRAQEEPWEWAYHEADRIAARREFLDDPVAYRSKLEAEIRQKLTSERSEPPSETDPGSHTPALPGSLATARGVGARTSDSKYAGPKPMEQIVRFKG